MKKILLPASFVLSSVVIGSAYAATATTTLDVVAVVGLTCNVTTTPVDFGLVNPAVQASTTGGISVTCPGGTPYNIALDAGQNFTGNWRAISDGLNTLEYGLFDPATLGEWGDNDYDNIYPYGPSVAGAGTGYTTNHVINAELFPGAVPEGVYSDVVNVTVYY